MTLLGAARLACVAAAAILAGAGCGSGVNTPSPESCGGVIGLGVPACTCRSWTNHVIPTGETSVGDNGVLVPDWSTSPPQASVKVGVRFSVSAVVIQEQPYQCNQGAMSNDFTWAATDSSVLVFEGKTTPSSRGALFRAAAPGTSRVTADNLLAPGGGTTRAELTVCNRGATGSLQDGYICSNRVPLVIRVVP